MIKEHWNIDNEFLEAIENSYKNYLLIHARSNKKLIPLHGYISKKLSIILGKEYKIKSLGFDNGKESNFKGKFYDKNIDIAVFKNNIELGGIGIKFITGNYKQNGNNYFENMLGETVNIKRVGTKYAQIIIIKEKIPYFSSDKNLFTKIENISDNDLKKYIILDLEKNEFAHKPDLIYINLIKTGDEKIIENNLKIKIDRKIFNQNILFPNVKCKFSEIKLSNNFSFKTKEYLVKHSNLENFLIAFSNYIKANEYGK
ncbi:MAG: hypothetical protein H9Q65_04485 [Spiroplasma ixodetis]|nr:hypothetical protein [Spiroplasma ixodetis]MBP1527059.1 hypothetical protein [Spiroplasma ixodetis]MBP1528480.1 hypothetical protein [Spiroplasma ixodetis]